VAVSGDVAAVVNTNDNSLDVFDAADGGTWVRRCPPATPGCTRSVQFDANTSPLYAAFDDANQAIYVSLQGNTQAAGPTGNAVARVALVDLTFETIDLSADGGIDLKSDGGTQSRPNGVAVGNGQVYVALANLAGFTAQGPGLVAVLDVLPDAGAMLHNPSTVALGEGCVNAGAVLLAGTTLYVACGPQYDPSSFAVVAPGALAAVNTATLAPAFAPQVLSCPADAGSCTPGGASRMAIAGGKLYLGDSADGRLFVADPTTGVFSRGAANALSICPAASGGFANISDVAARP
jgi:DNA-binding beta-propeller fold protein YncE